MKTPLPLNKDYTRCYGNGCAVKDSCHRFLTIRIDPVGLFSYVENLHHENDAECDYYKEFKR